jgi:ATP-dependent Lon protease
VGKTSLGRSIARALGRRFVHLSLGGVHDEAEIRGHRRTYVGAMPGRIIQCIHHAGTRNPVFMLDEVDKIGVDFRGDPSSALLEVLDHEQNFAFRDNYLGVPFDLSEVMFLTTANVLDTIQPAFRDRMEVITIGGYTEEEKVAIAARHLIPRQLEAHGLASRGVEFVPDAVRTVIRGYTREAGVRNLERRIGAICRKLARAIASERRRSLTVTPRQVARHLGKPDVVQETQLRRSLVGVATGLAWTPEGGQLLFVEATAMRGKGVLTLTGQLGEVMRESARAAVSHIRTHAARLGLGEDFFAEHDLHVHVPEGGIPKDGPSAGVTIATAITSLVTGHAVQTDIAMTGEMTLRGDILPVGGIKEKILAARRCGIRRVALPGSNRRDLDDLAPDVKADLEFLLIRTIDEALAVAIPDLAVRPPEARRARS